MANVHTTDKSADSRRRILQAARAEIETKGILGLRVQDVAKNAGVSVPLIYKYFGDRDGLLADVLSQMFEESSVRHLSAAGDLLANQDGHVTVEGLARAFAIPQDDIVTKDRTLTLQMLAAAAEIPVLAQRLAETQKEVHVRLTSFVRDLLARMDLDTSVPVPALSMLIQSASLGLVYNDMLGEDAVSKHDFAEMIRVLVRAVVESHTPHRS